MPEAELTSTNWKAVSFMIISALAFAIMNLLIKYLASISAYQLVLFRSLTSLVICYLYLKHQGINPRGNSRGWLLMRGLVGTLSMTLFFLSVKLIPLGSAVSIRYLSPIFAVILAIALLGEKVLKRQWLFYALALLGLFLLRGFEVQLQNYGFLLALGSAASSGMVYVIVRRMGTSEHPVVVVWYFMVCASIISFPISLATWVNPTTAQLPALLIIGIFGFFGQYFMTRALQMEVTNKVSPIRYTEAIFVIIISYLWFGESYTLLGFIGMVLIMVGMTLNVLIRKVKPGLPP